MGLGSALRFIFEPLFARDGAGKVRRVGSFRGRPVRIRIDDMRHHVYIVGGSGTGKSRLIRKLVEQDIAAGHGMCLVDPHGDLCDSVVSYIEALPSEHPAKRRSVLVDPTAQAWSIGFNPLEISSEEDRYPAVLELLNVFKKLWGDSWGARMEDILRNSFVTLAESGLTLLELPKLLTDAAYRSQIVADLEAVEARRYWIDRYEPLSARTKAEWIESSLNKVSALISDPWMRDMLGQRQSTFDVRKWMDKRSIVLINLAKGRLKQNSEVIGALLVSKIQETALSRVDVPEGQRRPFRLYVDEFQHYATRSFEEILSEARKYGLPLVMAHQDLGQVDRRLLASVLANCQIQVYFRVSREDAEKLARQAFRATGKDIKFQLEKEGWLTSEPRMNPVFIPVNEEMESYVNGLLDLGHREALLNVRGGGRPLPFRTAEAPDRIPSTSVNRFRSQLVSRIARPRATVRKEIAQRESAVGEEQPAGFWE